MPGALSPAFRPDVYSYTATVPEGTNSVYVRATASDPGATLTGGGNIDVSSGSATVEINITAEDGITTQTYTIDITVKSSVGVMKEKLVVYPSIRIPYQPEILYMWKVFWAEKVSPF